MATRITDVLSTKGTHEIGFMQTMYKHRVTIPFGAVATANIDNFLPVLLDGMDTTGDSPLQKVKAVDSATAGNMYLVTTPELRPLQNVFEETLSDFYNKANEPMRVEQLVVGITTFQTTAFTLDANNTVADTGDVAYFNNTTQKYIVCDPANLPTAYNNAGTQFLVRYGVADIEKLDDRNTVSLLVTKN